MAEDIKDENEAAPENETLDETENSIDGLIEEEPLDTPEEDETPQDTDLDEKLENDLEENLDIEDTPETQNENELDQNDDQEELSEDTPIDTSMETAKSLTDNLDDLGDEEYSDNEDHTVQKKQSKLQKILMIVVGVLGGVLLFGFILYLFGAFDPDEPTQQVVVQGQDINQTKEPEKYIFSDKDINIDRLNSKLRILTKYEIIGTKEEEQQKMLEQNAKISSEQIDNLLLEEQKKEEEKRLAEEKKKQEELKKAQEEKKRLEEEKKRLEEEAKKAAQNPYDLLKFIQVNEDETVLNSIKPNLEKFEVKISKCKDVTGDFLLIGPFKTNKDLNSIFKEIYTNITQSTTKKDLARLEFDRICK